MSYVRRVTDWLREDIEDDIEEWQSRGIVLSSLLAACDAWFWFASGIRYVVQLWVVSAYLDDHLDMKKPDIRIWNAHPVVVDRIPMPVESNARIATAFVGLGFLWGFGFWPRITLGTPESRIWIASQFYFLLLDPLMGICYRGLVENSPETHGEFSRLTDQP
jgi:hypothetical protein